MKEFFGTVKFKIILAILALLFGMMLYSVTQGGVVNGASEMFGKALSPVQKLSNSITHKITKNIDMLMNADKYYKENQKLKTEIADLYQQLIDYEDKKVEIDELRKFIGIKEQHAEYQLSPPCTVIGRTMNDPFKSFTIDKGSKDGISVYDPVVTGDGLVGIVSEVADTYSTVKTVLNARSMSVGAICVETQDTGIVEGAVSEALKGKTRMVLINKDNTIKPGNLIKTSGDSGLFPQDYPIGIVESVAVDSSGLTSYAVIKPIVDISNVTAVMVITDLGID